jgi:hypothetical protein
VLDVVVRRIAEIAWLMMPTELPFPAGTPPQAKALDGSAVTPAAKDWPGWWETELLRVGFG